jgi:hypothetical protein
LANGCIAKLGKKEKKKKSNASCTLGDLFKPIIKIQGFFLFFSESCQFGPFLWKKKS